MPRAPVRAPRPSIRITANASGVHVGPGATRRTNSLLRDVAQIRAGNGSQSLRTIKARMRQGNYSHFAEQYPAAGLSRATALKYEIARLRRLDFSKGKKPNASNLRAQAERNIARVYD